MNKDQFLRYVYNLVPSNWQFKILSKIGTYPFIYLPITVSIDSFHEVSGTIFTYTDKRSSRSLFRSPHNFNYFGVIHGSYNTK